MAMGRGCQTETHGLFSLLRQPDDFPNNLSNIFLPISGLIANIAPILPNYL
jgi:hypothetical protein